MEKATRQVVMGARELVSERGTHTRISHERENGRARVKEMGNQRRTDCQGNGIPIGHQPIQGKEPYRLLVIRIPSCVGQLDGKTPHLLLTLTYSDAIFCRYLKKYEDCGKRIRVSCLDLGNFPVRIRTVCKVLD